MCIPLGVSLFNLYKNNMLILEIALGIVVGVGILNLIAFWHKKTKERNRFGNPYEEIEKRNGRIDTFGRVLFFIFVISNMLIANWVFFAVSLILLILFAIVFDKVYPAKSILDK
jgi:hypothetical protein